MSKLFTTPKNEYGDLYKDHLFEQYKLYIESIEKTSDRRHQANNYFIALNTGLISAIGISFQIKLLDENVGLRLLLAILGIGLCAIFYLLIRSYKQLNTGKFKVLHEIEETLPLSLYKHEWTILGEGKDKLKYYPFSHVELFIPWLLGGLYMIFGLFFSYILLTR